MTNFKIRTFGRTELAQLYCPELCPQAAFRKLNQWIDLYPNLREELLASGLSPKSRTYTDADYKLADMMCDYWTNFAKTGDPNGDTVPEWAPYTEDNKNIQVLDVTEE